VTANAAEALYLMGETDSTTIALLRILNSSNVYVKLRALNVIANRGITNKHILQKIKGTDMSNEYINNICNYILHQ
jgi:SOS response regulatory protein OraA/RecX